MNQSKLLFLASLFLFTLWSCFSEKKAVTVSEEPIVNLAKDHLDHNFSIVLHDMDVQEDDINIIYRHKYAILQPKEDSLVVDSTDWLTVSEDFFQANEDNLGMELVSIHDGVSSTTPKPVGFDWAIGNDKYGEWVADSTATTDTGQPEQRWRYHNGTRFLMYYWMFSRMTGRSTFRNYSQNYKGKRAFHGKGGTAYGTKSAYQRASRSSFYARKASSTSWKSHTKRASRKSSRYKGGASSRGRSGGIGK